MLRPHGQHVFTRHQKLADVIGECAVAIGALAQVVAVDPYPRVLVDALKGHPGQLSLCLLRKGKAEAVPADPAGQVARAAGTIPGKGQADRPVMGQAYALPAAVVQPLVGSLADFTKMKLPSLIGPSTPAHEIPPRCLIGVCFFWYIFPGQTHAPARASLAGACLRCVTCKLRPAAAEFLQGRSRSRPQPAARGIPPRRLPGLPLCQR